jgi:arabinan endo-1,5-alpha-L-arabinosidase
MNRSAHRLTRTLLGTLAVVGALALGAPRAAAYPYPGYVTGDTRSGDPSFVIRSGSPRYAVYSTANQTRYSNDRVNFTYAQQTMPVQPWWVNLNGTGDTWAPDVSYRNGQWFMYYSVSSFGSNRSAIGLATSPSGNPGTWTDHGKVIESFFYYNYNAIDPNLMVDASGRWWLSFGSFWDGIFMMELSPATGKAVPGATLIHLATRRPQNFENPIEAPFIFRRGAYYYLFVSFDYCCQGSNSTYNVRVGRSTSPTGPYIDAAGRRLLDGGGTIVLQSHDWVRGPGHVSVLHDSADNKDLLVYHYYDSRDGGVERYLGINWLGWDANGWPYVW